MAAWRFLQDDNVDPKVAAHLENEEVVAEYVRDALAEGADDEITFCRTPANTD